MCTSSYLSIKNKEVDCELEDDSPDDSFEYDTSNIVCESKRTFKRENERGCFNKHNQTILKIELQTKVKQGSLDLCNSINQKRLPLKSKEFFLLIKKSFS